MIILSWNILSDIWIAKIDKIYDKINKQYLYFNYRKKKILYIIEKINPDIILLQEIDNISYKFLLNILSNTYWISNLSNINWCNEENIKSCNNTGNVTLIKKNIYKQIFNVIKLHISKYRSCLLIQFDNYIIINIHLSSLNKKTRIQEIKNIIKYINNNRLNDKKIIIGGDFNNNILLSTEIHNILLQNNFNNYIKNLDPTYIMKKAQPIDFIYGKNISYLKNFNLSINNYINETNFENIIFKNIGSDHLPIITKIID